LPAAILTRKRRFSLDGRVWDIPSVLSRFVAPQALSEADLLVLSERDH